MVRLGRGLPGWGRAGGVQGENERAMMLTPRVGFIWDIDGVVLDSPHEESWRLTLAQEPWNTEGLSSDFYFHHLASRPRYECAHNILELLGVYQRLGAATEEDKEALREQYASQKDALVKDLIARGDFRLFADAVTLVLKARRAAVPQAAASSSKNASTMLKIVSRERVLAEVGDDFGAMPEGDTLYSVFDLDACGVEVGDRAEILKYAAQGLKKALGEEIGQFVVFEDAAWGVKAAKSLGYIAVGVWRLGERGALERAGADLVTADLKAVEVADLVRLAG